MSSEHAGDPVSQQPIPIPNHARGHDFYEMITSANQRDSRLLSLAPELRNAIYKHIFRGGVKVYAGYLGDWNKNQQSKFHILQTCRRIRHEATPIFYGNVTFEFELLFQIGNFVQRIQGLRLCCVRSLRLQASSACVLVDPAFRDSIYLLRVFLGLEEVRFRGHVGQGTRNALGNLVFRNDGAAVRIVFEEDG